MFGQLQPANRRQAVSLGTSLAVHLTFLVWVLHAPPPIFVAPAAVSHGENGEAVTTVYFGGDSGVTQKTPRPRVTWQSRQKASSVRQLAPLPPKMEQGNRLEASISPAAPAAGSPYGSLAYRTFIGPEVRPALPVYSPDPVMPSELSRSVMGDVVIEVTIDEAGNITQSIMLRGLEPGIDQKVLAAVQNWRFRPATRNGVAIASKQDVYYHFPR